MKFLPLVWKNIWRRKFRTTFTLLSIFIAFLLFGILMTIRNSFALGVEIAGLDRLVLINKVSLIMPLPFAYQARLQSVPGVEVLLIFFRGASLTTKIWLAWSSAFLPRWT